MALYLDMVFVSVYLILYSRTFDCVCVSPAGVCVTPHACVTLYVSANVVCIRRESSGHKHPRIEFTDDSAVTACAANCN